jgi:hypothetical protein
MNRKNKMEFGDFQTPIKLATEIVDFLKNILPNPKVIIEPNCGLGNFLRASINQWHNQCLYFGFDINKNYVDSARNDLNTNNLQIEVTDFFTKDWQSFFEKYQHQPILIIGNPPWVTNSALSCLNSKNVPLKSNFQKFQGLEAKLGKANFDIAEWILIQLIDSLKNCHACIGILCKTSTTRKVLKYFWLNDVNIFDTSIHLIDAKKHFNVSVNACLFIINLNSSKKIKQADVYADISFKTQKYRFGLVNNELIANINDFEKYNSIDGICEYRWRSGIKHDAAKVIELVFNGKHYINGFGEIVNIEDDYIYPLLKSSDLSNNRLIPNRFIIITQKKTGDDTKQLKYQAPKTWDYLEQYANILDNRKSIIYQKRPRFSLFGIGDYSFTPWKVAISGFYRNIIFSPIGNLNKKPIMVDDTCYFISCHSKEESYLLAKLLNSQPCQRFLQSLIFFDSKRPININILKRINFKKLAEMNLLSQEIDKYFSPSKTNSCQLSLFSKSIN